MQHTPAHRTLSARGMSAFLRLRASPRVAVGRLHSRLKTVSGATRPLCAGPHPQRGFAKADLRGSEKLRNTDAAARLPHAVTRVVIEIGQIAAILLNWMRESCQTPVVARCPHTACERAAEIPPPRRASDQT